jgi:hypothetical protein
MPLHSYRICTPNRKLVKRAFPDVKYNRFAPLPFLRSPLSAIGCKKTTKKVQKAKRKKEKEKQGVGNVT